MNERPVKEHPGIEIISRDRGQIKELKVTAEAIVAQTVAQ